MILSKQHKIYAAIFGVAVVGLILDRTVFKPADAVATSMDEYTVNANESSDDSGRSWLAAEQSLAKRLKDVSESRGVDPHQVRDIFTATWAQPTADPADDDRMTRADDEFARRHRLTAIMGAGGSGYVVIDGKCLRIGELIDGYVLKSVSSRSAVFRSAASADEFEMSLDRPSEIASPQGSVKP